jgi:integrase/recombinase XerD
VLAAAPELMADILRLLDQSGMREAEAVWLERTAIDREERSVTLMHTKTGRPRSIHWKTPGGDAEPILLAQQPYEGNPYVFPLGSQGEPYQNFSSNFGRVIRAVEAKCEKEGIPFRRWRVHHLRHRFAVRALRRGMSIYELQQHLGHRSITTTEIYLEYLPAPAQMAARRGSAQKPAQRVVSAQVDDDF